MVVFLSGVIHTHYYSDNNYHNHFSNDLSSEWLKVSVINQPKCKEKVISCKVQVIESFGKDKKLQGKAQVYFSRDSQSFKIKYGDQLIIKNRLQEIKDPRNQHQFNFRKFYNNQNIYHQGFFNPSQWVCLNKNTSSVLLSLGYSWQLKLRKLFKKYFEDDAIRGVAEAVIFGFKDDLDENWLKAFSKTGTIHVLAVSGLHVGIIYVLMSFLLGITKSKGVSLVIKSIGILVVLFLYSLLTGFSPSVSRASIMFGTVIIENSFSRKSSIYNSLCLACFVLLVINPLNIYNVGFQFSFLAVLGIVYYKDDIRRIFPDASYFFDKIYILLSISIAAQIATFPLGLFYFHQYPNLFMFSIICVLVFIANDWLYLDKIRQTEVVTFNVKKGLIVGFKSNNYITLIASDDLLKGEKKVEHVVAFFSCQSSEQTVFDLSYIVTRFKNKS